jgi:hypothetical protein
LTGPVAAQEQRGSVDGVITDQSGVPVPGVVVEARSPSLIGEFFEVIPKGRDFTSIVNLAPGANFEEKAGGIAIDGASGAENTYVLDGIDTTKLQTGVRAKDWLAMA